MLGGVIKNSSGADYKTSRKRTERQQQQKKEKQNQKNNMTWSHINMNAQCTHELQPNEQSFNISLFLLCISNNDATILMQLPHYASIKEIKWKKKIKKKLKHKMKIRKCIVYKSNQD